MTFSKHRDEKAYEEFIRKSERELIKQEVEKKWPKNTVKSLAALDEHYDRFATGYNYALLTARTIVNKILETK